MGIKSEDSTLTSGGAGAAPSVIESARALKLLVTSASEAPWVTRPNPDNDDQVGVIVSPKGDAELGNWMVASGVRWRENRAFIVAARNDLPAILDAYITAHKALEKVNLAQLNGCFDAALVFASGDDHVSAQEALDAVASALAPVASSAPLSAGSMHTNPSASDPSPSPKEER